MKLLLSITAIIEALTGLALIVMPSEIASLLLGVTLQEPSGILISRIGGAALISISIGCWFSRNNSQSGDAMVRALAFYNLAVALLLAYAGAFDHLSGLGLWPVVLLHAVMLGWCLKSIVRK